MKVSVIFDTKQKKKILEQKGGLSHLLAAMTVAAHLGGSHLVRDIRAVRKFLKYHLEESQL